MNVTWDRCVIGENLGKELWYMASIVATEYMVVKIVGAQFRPCPRNASECYWSTSTFVGVIRCEVFGDSSLAALAHQPLHANYCWWPSTESTFPTPCQSELHYLTALHNGHAKDSHPREGTHAFYLELHHSRREGSCLQHRASWSIRKRSASWRSTKAGLSGNALHAPPVSP